MSNIKRTLIVVGGLILIVAACIFAVSATHKFSLRDKVEAYVYAMNAKAPNYIGDDTYLTSVGLVDDTVAYTYTVEHDSLIPSIMDCSEDELKKAFILLEQAKALFFTKDITIFSNDWRDIERSGTAIKYVFQDKSDPSRGRVFTISNEELKQLHSNFRKLDREKVARQYVEYYLSGKSPSTQRAVKKYEQIGIATSFKFENYTATINSTYTAEFAQHIKDRDTTLTHLSDAAAIDSTFNKIDTEALGKQLIDLFPDDIIISCARAAYVQFTFNFRNALSDKTFTITKTAYEFSIFNDKYPLRE